MSTTAIKHHFSPGKTTSPGGEVRVFKSAKSPKKVNPSLVPIPKLSEKTRRTFEAISDPKNAHLFTVEASLKAFAHIEV
ncbi:hypothetical protein [Acidovorax sp. KKS102]|uniref:hypothetical protein n=1 Tax=Acidovorax sp. KKS102 TaxID=358220 RepID=UPI0011D28F2C|nr:hypothetical protein [Acidovorax sp. KKS102]